MLLRILCLAAALALAGCQSGPGGSTGPRSSAGTLAYAAPQEARDPRYAAIVLDATSNRSLHAVNADALRHPASLTKMMTLYVLFEELDRGRFHLGSQLVVTPEAAAQPPSRIGLRAGETITVETAIQALAVKSANDVAVVVADAVSGSEAAFADRMTRTARALGMSRTTYRNASGLPDPGQVTTARDVTLLARALQTRFPRYYRYFSQRTFEYEGRNYDNTNKLLGKVAGMDGIKTGYIRASGYNLATSVRRGGKHLIVVVMGGRTGAARDAEVTRLVASYMPVRGRWMSALLP